MLILRISFHLLCALIVCTAFPIRAQTVDTNAEARVYFERGNEFFESARDARGSRRRRLLEEALQNYVRTLRIVRSRNALFNAAIVLEQLERPREAFGYYHEYLDIPGLSEEEREQGETRIDALRPSLGILRVYATAVVEVFIDRLDLAPRGRVPLEIALAPGEHTVFFRHPHYHDAQAQVQVNVGETSTLRMQLEMKPVALHLRTTHAGEIFLNGEMIEPGHHSLIPGRYTLRFEVPGYDSHEQLIELQPGSESQTIELRPGLPNHAQLSFFTNVDASVQVDGAEVIPTDGREANGHVAPGRRRFRVQAPGHQPIEDSITVAPGQQAIINVDLRPKETPRPLGIWPHVALSLTAASMLTSLGLGVRALRLHNDFRDDCPVGGRGGSSLCDEGRIDSIQSANLQADIMLGVTGALAVGTILMYVFNQRPENESSSFDVRFAAGVEETRVTLGRRF